MEKNKLKALVVDDEKDARDILKYYLSDIPAIAEIEEASNAEEALFKYLRFNPDLIFLDIVMPGRDGSDLIELLKHKEPGCQIIIVSSYKESAIMAIQNNVYDFILKPIDFSILKEKVEEYQLKNQLRTEKKLNKVLNAVDQGMKIRISSTNNHILVDPTDIVYCEADGSYTNLILENGTTELANSNIGRLEKSLCEHHFFRISRSLMINLIKLSSVNKNDNSCTLSYNDTEIKLYGSKKQIKILCEMDFEQE